MQSLDISHNGTDRDIRYPGCGGSSDIGVLEGSGYRRRSFGKWEGCTRRDRPIGGGGNVRDGPGMVVRMWASSGFGARVGGRGWGFCWIFEGQRKRLRI